jgi:transcription-repair coupling factor (superfamily II helicase)
MAEHNELGKLGEELAAEYLQKKGYVILATNWVFQKAEIDILAQKENTLAVVEVKTRSSIDFGPLPKQAVSLLSSMKIKWIATRLGIEKLVMKQGKMIGYFVSDQQSDYYQSGRFHQVLQFVQKQSGLCKMKEKQTSNGLRLLLTFDNVKSIRKALELMELMGQH